jgi:hypothetical protein
LTSKKAGTVGNDWKQPRVLPEKTKQQINDFTTKIGKAMAKSGFKGMFGLDLVVQNISNDPYIIEINARQPASIPIHTKLQLARKQIPLQLLAIAEFMGIDYELDTQEYNRQSTEPIEAAQIFFRNRFDSKAQLLGGIKPGLYKLTGENLAYDWAQGKPRQKKNVIIIEEQENTPLVFLSEDYCIDEEKEAGLLILCAKEGKNIAANTEVARIQSSQSLIDSKGNIKAWMMRIITGINKTLILKEHKDDR